MNLVRNWREVLKNSYVVRWAIAAAIFSGLEMILPIIRDFELLANVPQRWFVAMSFCCTVIAVYARIVAQNNIGGSNNGNPPR